MKFHSVSWLVFIPSVGWFSFRQLAQYGFRRCCVGDVKRHNNVSVDRNKAETLRKVENH